MNSFDLKKFPWSLMTREERYYCAHLFFLIRQDREYFANWFVKLHNKRTPGNKIREGKKWDIGYEVCFYRDYIHWFKYNGRTISNTDFSPKRTFDLAMFSGNEIIIFEAKVHEIFDTEQVNEIRSDKGTLHPKKNKSLYDLFGNDIKVWAFAIAPSKYYENTKKFTKGEWLNKDCFDGKITWAELSRFYEGDKVLLQADLIRYSKDIQGLKEAINESH